MPVSKPGPQPTDSVRTGFGVNLGNRMSRRDWLVDLHSEAKERVRTATHIATGEWYVEWPDLTTTPEAPTVANLVEMGINHWTSVFGAVVPSIRVPISPTVDRSQGRRGARKRERRLRELWRNSNVTELAALLGGDYAGGGSAVLGAWANFGESNPAKRDPYLIRYDPRHTYVLKDNIGNITELLVARKISRAELAAMSSDEFPGLEEYFGDAGDEDIEEWFWYDNDKFFYALVDVSEEGRKANRHLVLVDEENMLGFVPAWEAVRPTFDGQRRGVFDQTIHILRTMHRLMTMTIQSTEESVFAPIAEFDVANPEDFGPGATLHYRSPEAKIDRLGPEQHFDAKDLIARLGEEAARAGAFPQQLSGEPGASIVSARGINASMGQLDARLALGHKQFEKMFSEVCGYLLAIDEIYCDGEKPISGQESAGEDGVEMYLPSRDVNGAWVAECTYGIGAGSDPANIEVRLQMHLGGGLISKERARLELPFLDDPEKEPLRIFREQMADAVVAGVLARSEQGDPTIAAEAMKLAQKEDVDFDEVIEKLVDVIVPPEPSGQGQGSMDPLAALQGGESLARGGIPGNAEQAPLPPLSQILGQDSRQVT